MVDRRGIETGRRNGRQDWTAGGIQMRVAILAALGGAIAFAGTGVCTRQGHLRDQLGRRSGSRRLLPSPRRRHVHEIRPRRYDPSGRPDFKRRHAADRRQDRILHGRRHDWRFSGRREQHSDHRRRGAFPEESADLHVASWRRSRQMGRSSQARIRPSSALAQSIRSGPGCGSPTASRTRT